MRHHYAPSFMRSKRSGFTLIEVLISIVILGIALLGLAALQIRAMAAGSSTKNRLIATQEAYEMVDRIRANQTGFTNSKYDHGVAASFPGCLAYPGTGCDSTALAGNDLFTWNAELAANLPSGQGVVCITSTPAAGTNAVANGCDGVGTQYVVKIWWLDDKSASNTTGALQLFYTLVRP